MQRHTQFRPEQIADHVYLAPGAVVVGDVTVGADSSVWYQAVLRGDVEAIRVGERTNIRDGCVLHADPGLPCELGDGVTVGHSATVHGAFVEDNVMIGMGAIVLNGARIGRDSIVGAGALVTEGMEVPAGSLVLGLPGRVHRSVTQEEIENNRRAAQHYVENAHAFLADRPAESRRPTPS